MSANDAGPPPSETRDVYLDVEPVELYKILKFESLVNSGGEAKVVIDEGLVYVNGEPETRRRRKIRHNDVIEFENVLLNVIFDSDAA